MNICRNVPRFIHKNCMIWDKYYNYRTFSTGGLRPLVFKLVDVSDESGYATVELNDLNEEN